jgi:hypothetical protein
MVDQYGVVFKEDREAYIWLGILGVINLLGWVERGLEVLKKVGLLNLLTVQLDDNSVVGVDNQSVELGGLDNSGCWGSGQMLLLVLAGLGVLVVDDEVDLVGGTALVGTKHDDVGGDVGELILVESLVVAEKLQVSSTTLKTVYKFVSVCFGANQDSLKRTLELDLILNNEGLALVVNLLGELGRDGMMSCGVLDHKTLVTFHALVDMRLLDSPFSYVCPFLILVGTLRVLLGVGRLPSRFPVVGELLDEVTLDFCRL